MIEPEIGFDKKRELFIAYNTYIDIVTTDIDVEKAIALFHKKRNQIISNSMAKLSKAGKENGKQLRLAQISRRKRYYKRYSGY